MSNKQNHSTNSNQTSVTPSNVQASPAANTVNNTPTPPVSLTNPPSWLMSVIEVASKIDPVILNEKIKSIDINKTIELLVGKIPTAIIDQAMVVKQQPSQQSTESMGEQTDVRVIKKDGAVTIHLNDNTVWVKEFDYTDTDAWSDVGIDIPALLTYVGNDISKINIIVQ